MKNKPNKHTWVSVLMICSQILLAGFLIFWITKEFQSEKQALKKELNANYEFVFNRQIDTLIFEKLINPTLQDSTFFEFSFDKMSDDSTRNDSTNIDIIVKDNRPHPLLHSKDSIKIISLTNELHNKDHIKFEFHDSIDPDSIPSINITKNDMMVKSVKMFITHTEENLNPTNFTQLFKHPLDSNQVITDLNHISEEQNQKLTYVWNTKQPVNNRAIEINIFEEKTPALFATNYLGYLLKQLLAEIIFALFLLILSGTALLLAWRSLQQQKKLNTLRNDFMANISHELKTPVTTVKIALEAIRKYNIRKDTSATEEYLSMAVKETDRLESLLEKVLQHAVFESENMMLQRRDIKLEDLVQELIQKMVIPITNADASVKIHAPEEEVIVNADPIYIEGLIRNLIDNSLKYAGPKAEIAILFRKDNKGISLTVKDHGPGIPEEYLGQVFDKFFRVPAGDKHDVKGYGLGLYFAAQVMQNHGGKIGVENLAEGGCAFRLNFVNKENED